jgi:hypothetical protein
MIVVKRFLFLIILIFLYQSTCASAKPLPGYIITSAGDSVRCNIDFIDWYKNPESIQVEVKNEKRTLKPSDIKGFGVYGYTDYKSAVINYHTNPINGTELPAQFSDSTITKAVFLKVLIKGAYTLYEFNLTDRKYYFVQKSDGEISELLYRVCVVLGEIKEDKQYANTLAGFFMQEDLLDRYKGKIYGASYNSDINTLINVLNAKYGGRETRKAPSPRFQAGVYAGGIVHFFPSSVSGNYTENGKLNSSTSFSGGVNLLYLTTGHLNAIKFGLSIGYDSYKTTGQRIDSVYDKGDPNDWYSTTRTAHLSLTNRVITSNVYATYTLNPAAMLKFYLKLGFSWGVGKTDTYVENNYTTTTKGFNSGTVIDYSTEGKESIEPIANQMINPNFGVGIESNRHKLEFSYYYPMNFGENSAPVFKVGMVGLFYYFNILN